MSSASHRPRAGRAARAWRRNSALRFFGAALGFGFAAAASHAQFTNVTAQSGISYLHAAPGTTGLNGQGAIAAVDVDGDGWTDILGARHNDTPVLYINNRDGTFSEEAAVRGLSVAVNAGAFAAADFSNKGSPDIFIAPESGSRFYFFVNDGTGHFTEQAVARGAAIPTSAEPHQGYSISVVDYDRDGYLDVYICEWGPSSTGEASLHSVLLHNLGAANPGHFENVTAAAGLVQPPLGHTVQNGYSAAWVDFDGDGWPDLYLASDNGLSRLYWNNGNGTFTDGTDAAGVGKEDNGMGLAVADYDGDGRPDIFVTSIYDQLLFTSQGTKTGHKLYHNLGSRHFEEVATAAGVAHTGWAWGAAFLDYNNDGAPDLIFTQGMDGVQTTSTQPFWGAPTQPTMLFRGDGTGKFTDVGASLGITDAQEGKGLAVADLDNDGWQDVVIGHAFAGPVIYHNANAASGNHWIRFKLTGTQSNRDGIGAIVKITAGGKTQTQVYNPTNAYLAQHEAVVHFGLGAAASVDSVQVTWPSGTVQTASNLAANTVQALTEPRTALLAPVINQQPSLPGGTIARDGTLLLSVVADANPAPSYTWQKDGVTIAGANQATLKITHIGPFDAGAYHVILTNSQGTATSVDVNVAVTIDLTQHSVARWWDEFLLDAIRKDTPNPPVHARNLYHLSAAMWDAFWAYQPEGWSDAAPVFVKEVVSPADWTGGREAAQAEALSYAAFRVLTKRFQKSPGAARSEYGFRWLMQQMGYDPDYTGTSGTGPADVGNRIGYGVLAATLNDGANEANGYTDATGYKAKNDPMIVALPGTVMADPSHWQPLALKQQVTQNGIILPDGIQSFVGVNARDTTPFALAKPTPSSFSIDPGPPPQFNSATHAAYVQEALDVIEKSAALDASDGVTVDISPGAILNNPLGTNAGTGHSVNPATGKPYASNVVKRGDYARVLSEFWADGPRSETPPGHWNVIFNTVTDDPRFVRRFAGTGPVLTPLEWDVRGYLALNGAVHDAACLAWGLKRMYDSARPISMVRYLASLGQSSDPAQPSYNALGLPLKPGLIEVITADSSAPGQRHAALAASVGQIALHVWQGSPADTSTQSGVGWILASKWVPYQLATFVTPAFPGFMSGHSTFSRAAAEVMALITGSAYFPGGLADYSFTANQFLTFERGPSANLSLQWATYYDAADQAGLSRLYGGIHSAYDDFAGRRLGSRVGLEAYLKAQSLRHAAAPGGLINLSTRARMGSGENALIAGFVIDGAASQPTLLRCVGPTLSGFGIPASQCDPDPSLAVHRSSDGAVILTNDNWSTNAQAVAARQSAVGAFALADGSADAAAVAALDPGLYTVVTSSTAPDKHGIALAEVYGQQLINLSARGSVGSGDNVLIAGFAVSAPETVTVLVRAAGPALASFGVQHPLANPVLTVYQRQSDGSNVVVATNDNWSDDPRASLTADAAMRASAFPLESGSKDAALLLQLPAGLYSAVVSSGDGSEGVAIAEVYLLK